MGWVGECGMSCHFGSDRVISIGESKNGLMLCCLLGGYIAYLFIDIRGLHDICHLLMILPKLRGKKGRRAGRCIYIGIKYNISPYRLYLTLSQKESIYIHSYKKMKQGEIFGW